MLEPEFLILIPLLKAGASTKVVALNQYGISNVRGGLSRSRLSRHCHWSMHSISGASRLSN